MIFRYFVADMKPKPRRLSYPAERFQAGTRTTHYDIKCALGLDTRCLDCAFDRNHDKDKCSYVKETREILPVDILPHDKLIVTTTESGEIGDSTSFRLKGGAGVNFLLEMNNGCSVLRSKVHHNIDKEKPSFLVLALENNFYENKIKTLKLHKNALVNIDTDGRSDCDAKILLIIKFESAESELLSNMTSYVSKQSRMSVAHQTDRLSKAEFVNYATPGKFLYFLKHHVSNAVFRQIGKYPRDNRDLIETSLQKSRSKTKNAKTEALKSIAVNKSGQDSGGFSDDNELAFGDIRTHKITRKRKSKGYGSDDSEGEDESYKPSTYNINKSKLKENLTQKTDNFKKRKTPNKKAIKKVDTKKVEENIAVVVEEEDDIDDLDDLFD